MLHTLFSPKSLIKRDWLLPPSKTAFERFVEKIMFEPMSGCWIWGGAMAMKSGYGRCWNGKKSMMAHRYSFECFKGEIPPELVVDHKCRNRLCVNPDHLRAVTELENIMCGTGEAARNAKATHCVNGHSLTDAYIKVDHRRKDRRTYRHCKTCAIEQSLARYYAKNPKKVCA